MKKTLDNLASLIQVWGREAGFQQIGITAANTQDQKERFEAWLAKGYHGNMAWLEDRADLRLNPDALVPGVERVITARMDYLPADTEMIRVLKSPEKAYISRYALGRDYHKLIRKRLAGIAKKIEDYCHQHCPESELSQRAFVDSAPILERPLAEKAGLGWVGKHTLLINPHAGSWFFLGEILTNLPLPLSTSDVENQCGECKACLQVCPTDAFPEPYVLDARRCISYLTIENKGPIPEEFREVMGNRVFGCDDCQAICPWNKFARPSSENDFTPRHGLDNAELLELFLWDENTYLGNTEGSPIRRIGFHAWLRNLSVGLGNAPKKEAIQTALCKRLEENHPEWLKKHFAWALDRQKADAGRRKRKLRRSD